MTNAPSPKADSPDSHSVDPAPGEAAEGNARESERVTINKEFSSFDEFLQEYVTNISRSGVFIKTKTPLAVGTVVNLRFTVIMEGIETVEGTGEVTRIAEGGMGVVFREVSAYSKAIIERLLVGNR